MLAQITTWRGRSWARTSEISACSCAWHGVATLGPTVLAHTLSVPMRTSWLSASCMVLWPRVQLCIGDCFAWLRLAWSCEGFSRVAVLENKAELSLPMRRRSTAIHIKPNIWYTYINGFMYSYFQSVVELGDPLRRRSTTIRLLSGYIQMQICTMISWGMEAYTNTYIHALCISLFMYLFSLFLSLSVSLSLSLSLYIYIYNIGIQMNSLYLDTWTYMKAC